MVIALLLTVLRITSQRNIFPKQNRSHLFNHADFNVVVTIASIDGNIEDKSAEASYFLRLSATDINLNHLRQNHSISLKKENNND